MLDCGHKPPRPKCPVCQSKISGQFTPQNRTPLECIHLGEAVPANLAPDTQRTYRQCDRGHGVVCACNQCQKCSEFAIAEPYRIHRPDKARLSRGTDGNQFNASIIEFEGSTLMAYRTDWRAGRIHIAALDDAFQPIDTQTLDLTHWQSNHGQDDPRLFIHDRKLNVAFCGVEQRNGRRFVHQMLAELSVGADIHVERIWYPHLSARREQEKNWAFFSHGGYLHCVYETAKTHDVLDVMDSAALGYSTPLRHQWSGGLIRGGASPVLVGGEYYHWFHGVKDVNGFLIYSTGLLTFEADPPFRVTRMTRGPVWTADPSERAVPKKDVIFPCGAILRGRRWFVSAGHQDKEILIAEFDADEIETLLEPV